MAEVKSFKTDSAKQLWRERIVDFVRRHYSPGQLRNLQVLCLAGKEMQEVFEIYDQLGVKRRNIVSLEEITSEYEAEKRLNESLDQPITVVNSPVTAYLNQVQNRRFDIVCLDYCGYFDDERYLDISKLALRGLLGPRAILITNYQMAREGRIAQHGLRRTGLFVNEHERLIHADPEQFKQFILDNVKIVDNETSLGDLRNITVQGTPIAEMYYGTGFWNTHYFKTFLSTQPEEYKRDTTRAIEQFNLSLGGENRELLSKLMVEGQPRDVALLMMFFTKSQTRSFECFDHEAYKYVSDSRTPMISDFYFFEEERFNLPANVRNSVTYQIINGKMAIRIKHTKKAQQLLAALNQYHLNMYRQSLNQGEIKIPLERVVLKADEKLEVNEKSGVSMPTQYVAPEQEQNQRTIYDDIAAKMSDDEIKRQYGLTTMQLAGHKAAYTRRIQKELRLEEQRVEDVILIRDFLAEGHPAEEIASLFEGRYTPEQIVSCSKD
ncbi:hypothetical protein COY27_00315 [Candidatus Woesearchaeota archaeon CG_4_10_14_0_2_um_filter_33_13]|nr:MAG: hypothetical protein COY27_00315 [Candidatus Woesearchaeota archaeon CG_4_10_14_0_2_um_filter_33_13]